MVAHARTHGWRKAVSDLFATQHPGLFRYITDEAIGDWLHLLPARSSGSALCVGGALSAVPLLLADNFKRVVVDAQPHDLAFLEERAREHASSNIQPISYPLDVLVEQFDLVAGLRHAPQLPAPRWRVLQLGELANRVKPGGYIYLELDHPSLLVPPLLMKHKLRALGFIGITFYWPKPSFHNCEMLIQLGDRRLQHYYLNTIFFSTSVKRRALRSALSVAVRLGLFELTLPGYTVIAQRKPGTPQNSGTPLATRIGSSQGASKSKVQTSRVMYVDAYPKIGGGQQSLYILATQLTLKHYEPLAALADNSPLRSNLSAAGVRSVGVHFTESNYTMPSLLKPWTIILSTVSVVRTIFELIGIARRERVDLIHANSVVAGAHALPVSMILRLPCIVHARDFNTAALTNACVKLMLRYPRSMMVFVSKALARHYGAGNNCGYHYRVMYNAIDTDIFRPRPEARAQLLQEYGLPAECFLLGSVGRIERWKGHNLLLDAFSLVVKKHPQARLLIVGDIVFDRLKATRDDLMKKAHKLGLDGPVPKVIFTGFRKDIPFVMAGLDALVHCPIEPEAFGLILAEAMSCSKPVVTVPLGGIPELVSDGTNGLLARPGDRRSIAAAISHLIENPALAHQLGEAGRKVVDSRFNLEREGAEVQRLYDEMLQIATPHVSGRKATHASQSAPVEETLGGG